jgi:rhamnose utilization protein RhaD (predicted bifunctional aldolase and dehydrogenase)
VLAGGGNTSVKLADHMLVKGSGSALATIRPEDFVDLDRAALQALLDRDLGSDRVGREAAFKQAVLAARREPERKQRPSVEAVLHHLMPARFVVHLHATLVNQFSCCRSGRRLVTEHLGENVLWVDLVDPGFALAKALQAELRAFANRRREGQPRAVVMQNHGLVVSGDTPDQVRDDLDWLTGSLRRIQELVAVDMPVSTGLATGRSSAPGLVDVITQVLRDVLSPADEPAKVVWFDGSDAVFELMAREDARDLAMGGPLTPDQIVYCRSFPLWVEARADEGAAGTTERLAVAVRRYVSTYQVAPMIVLVEGVGMFACGDTQADAGVVRLVYLDAIKVMAGALRMGGVNYLPEDFRNFIEHWEVEQYRRAMVASS